MKVSPFKLVNQGESIDINFFTRLQKFENYYLKLQTEDHFFINLYETIVHINKVLQHEKLDFVDIAKAIEIYNSGNISDKHKGTAWFDLRLHLRHLAFVYGTEFHTDKDLNLIEKVPDDNMR